MEPTTKKWKMEKLKSRKWVYSEVNTATLCMLHCLLSHSFDLEKGSPYSIAEHRVPVFVSQPAGDVSHKPGSRLPLLTPGLQLPLQPLKGLLPVSLLGEQRHDECEQFA